MAADERCQSIHVVKYCPHCEMLRARRLQLLMVIRVQIHPLLKKGLAAGIEVSVALCDDLRLKECITRLLKRTDSQWLKYPIEKPKYPQCHVTRCHTSRQGTKVVLPRVNHNGTSHSKRHKHPQISYPRMPKTSK